MRKEQYKFNDLRNRIRSQYGRMSDFAKDLGVAPGTLTQKLKGTTEWTHEEIADSVRLLKLTGTELCVLFKFF